MSDFGYEEGISNQNAMTSQAIRANAMSEDIRKRTIDELQRNLKTNLSTLDGQQRNDEVVSGSRDLFSVGNDLGQFYSSYKDISSAGGFGAYLRGAGAGDRLSTIAGGLNKGLTGIGSGLGLIRDSRLGQAVGRSVTSMTDPVAIAERGDSSLSRGSATTQFLDESGRAGGVDARATGTFNVANRNVAEVRSGALRAQNANLPVTTPQANSTTAPITPQVQNPARDDAQGTNRPPANPTTQGDTQGARSSVAGSSAPAVEDTEETETEGSKLFARLNDGIDSINSAKDTISTVNKVAGTAMGITSGIVDVVKASDGDFGKMNGWDQASDIAGIVSGGIDAVSLALPFLAPIGALSSAVEAITGTVGEIKDIQSQRKADKDGESGDEDTANQTASSQAVSPILSAQGMIASRTMDNTAQIRPSSSF
jgi:hypothetical protein